MNLMVGHRCPIIHQATLKARADVKNGHLKTIKATLRLSLRIVHALMFEVGSYFLSLTTTNQSFKGGSVLFGTSVSPHKVHL